MPKTLDDMRADHRRYDHRGQAATIAANLRQRFPALQIIGPEDAESGKFIAVYVTLVPRLVRMRCHLTSSGLNQHSYRLEPVTETRADQRLFVDYMAHHHPAILLKQDGQYAQLLGWARANVKNDNHSVIARHVQDALNIFSNTPSIGANQ